jgi:hypothetical protein
VGSASQVVRCPLHVTPPRPSRPSLARILSLRRWCGTSVPPHRKCRRSTLTVRGRGTVVRFRILVPASTLLRYRRFVQMRRIAPMARGACNGCPRRRMVALPPRSGSVRAFAAPCRAGARGSQFPVASGAIRLIHHPPQTRPPRGNAAYGARFEMGGHCVRGPTSAHAAVPAPQHHRDWRLAATRPAVLLPYGTAPTYDYIV